MGDILKPQMLPLFLVFTVPGIIALYFRGQFLVGKMPAAAEGAISYITLSLCYHAIAFPLARPLYMSGAFLGWYGLGSYGLGWFTLIFLAPGILGILLGLNIRKGWTKKILNRLGLTTVHPVNSAWDWKFGYCPECWLIVTLKDDTKWYGYVSTNSFMSSDPTERDLFIEQVYEFKDEGEAWTPRNTSVWIAHGEIQSLEFLTN